MTNSLSRPSKLLATISALVIAGNLFLLSAFIAANVVEPNPFAMMGGLFVLPLCVLMAAQQYRGTFRRLSSAAKTTSVLLYGFGGFLLFGVATWTGEAVLKGVSLHLMTSILIPMAIAASFSIAIGRMNALWSQRIRAAVASGAVAPVCRSVSLRELLLAVGIVAAMTGITSHFIRSAPPRYAENVDVSAAPVGLPVGAADVSYCKGYRGTIAYEFTINESAFRDSAAGNHVTFFHHSLPCILVGTERAKRHSRLNGALLFVVQRRSRRLRGVRSYNQPRVLSCASSLA